MDRHEITQSLRESGIIAIVRADADEAQVIEALEACLRGGVRCVEVTMTTPGALRCIEAAAKRFAGGELLLGVGSVLDAETCRLAILAGAQYVVSPITDAASIRMAHRYGKTILPGAYTPNEVFQAWELGGDLIKVFPAAFGGPAYLKALAAPMPQIPLAPTGGITVENVGDFLAAGAKALGVGSNLISPKLVAAGDFAGIEANARRFAEAWAAARA